MIVDYTLLSTFLTCPMKYKLFIQDGLVPKEKPTALSFGGAIHVGLSVWYRTNDVEKAIEAFRENYHDVETDAKRTVAVGERLLREYFVKYAEEPFKVLFTERPYAADLGYSFLDRNYAYRKWEPIIYSGRFDAIIRWGDFVYAFEHKTTIRISYSYFDQFYPNLQLDGYSFLCKALVGQCDGVLVNALGVNKSKESERQKKGTSNYFRHISARTEKQLAAFQEDTCRVVECIHHATIYGGFYMNKTACEYYGRCPYKDICENNFDKRIIEMRYKKTPWDPLLGRKKEVS